MEEHETDWQGAVFEPYEENIQILAEDRGVEVGCLRMPVPDTSTPPVVTMKRILDEIDTAIDQIKKGYAGWDVFCCHAGLRVDCEISDISDRDLVFGDKKWINRPTVPDNTIVIFGHWNRIRPIKRRTICLALEGQVAVMVLEEQVIVTSEGITIEVKNKDLGL